MESWKHGPHETTISRPGIVEQEDVGCCKQHPGGAGAQYTVTRVNGPCTHAFAIAVMGAGDYQHIL